MKTLALCLLVFCSLGIRLIRWLAWVQQKEYRLDRLWLFISSPEGQKELLRVLPTRADFARKTFKRPKLTPRLLTVALTVFLLLGGYALLVAQFVFVVQALWLQVFSVLVALGVVSVLMPLFVMVGVIPSAGMSYAAVTAMARRAQLLLVTHQPVVIGVTGSFGKTSTKQLLGYVLGGDTQVFITPASHNTLYSVCKSIVDGYKGQKYVVLEYGAYAPGEIATLAKFCPPLLAVITGFAPQHLGLFGSEEAIIKAKSELVAALKPESLVFYNAVYPQTKEIAQKGAQKNDAVLTPVLPTNCFTNIELTADGRLVLQLGSEKVTTKLLGTHYAEIAALVVTVAQSIGISQAQCAKRLAGFTPTNKFITSSVSNKGITIIDDGGTSNPQGFMSALDLLAAMQNEPKVMITPGIVDLGDKSEEIHRQLGQAAQTVVDTVLYVGETGKEAFMQGYTGDLVDSPEKCTALLHSLPSSTVLLLEGRMPGWVLAELETI